MRTPAVEYREEAIRAKVFFRRILNLKTECPVWHPVEAQGRIEQQLLGKLRISIIGSSEAIKHESSKECASESQAKERRTWEA